MGRKSASQKATDEERKRQKKADDRALRRSQHMHDTALDARLCTRDRWR